MLSYLITLQDALLDQLTVQAHLRLDQEAAAEEQSTAFEATIGGLKEQVAAMEAQAVELASTRSRLEDLSASNSSWEGKYAALRASSETTKKELTRVQQENTEIQNYRLALQQKTNRSNEVNMIYRSLSPIRLLLIDQ